MQPQELARRLATKQPPLVVDVRSTMEYRHGHIAGAIHAPTWKILFRLAKLKPVSSVIGSASISARSPIERLESPTTRRPTTPVLPMLR